MRAPLQVDLDPAAVGDFANRLEILQGTTAPPQLL
jgi:hypothetical protein